MRIPSAGQRFSIKTATYEVVKSSGFRCKAKVISGDPVTNICKFTLLGTKFVISKISQPYITFRAVV